MALTLAQWNRGGKALMRYVLLNFPDARTVFLGGTIDFVLNGPGTIDGVSVTQADRREVARTLMTVLFPSLSPHGRRHLLIAAGAPYAQTEDVPDTPEPTS